MLSGDEVDDDGVLGISFVSGLGDDFPAPSGVSRPEIQW